MRALSVSALGMRHAAVGYSCADVRRDSRLLSVAPYGLIQSSLVSKARLSNIVDWDGGWVLFTEWLVASGLSGQRGTRRRAFTRDAHIGIWSVRD